LLAQPQLGRRDIGGNGQEQPRRSEGDEGKWFAAAKDAGFWQLAIDLAPPAILLRLTRSLRYDLASRRRTGFGQSYGYKITRADVWAAYSNTMKAARRLNCHEEVRDRIRAPIDNKGFVAQVLGREPRLPTWRIARGHSSGDRSQCIGRPFRYCS
jgi:hypothetical protein